MSIKQNLMSGQGETFLLDMTYQDSNGTPVNLTGHNVDLVVEKAGSGATVGVYSATVDNLGNILIKVADETTATWPVGKLAYRVEHETPSGDVRWLCYGALTIISGDAV